ncbi:unnamed protein product [Penicillium nalgiovense]|uniref:Uncharacterized protein n=3 Tax=Penicillium TaxID=5073 RepID=A0A9W4HLL2_PENNA|nr:hypothetical protein VN97_g10629 [Penicillium thymicola]CAG7990722.1 unnamed protein product [Penicillium nalgiovense]CAG7991143.1 unnamed protein product [Penicillium nalgiovense]CAG8000706.1 unnamed protein product [Penicillium nalgiovense]CAG8013446.1 unnamed protein product [Penicillium nalgiovense]
MTIGLVWISWDNLETKRIPLSTIMSLGEKEHRNPESSSAETPPPIQQPWARLTESVEPKFTQSQPTDELDTEIREAQAQLANLIRQRRLIELQQKIFDEQVALEVARNRLAATSKDRSPIVSPIVNDSGNTQHRVLATPIQNGYSKAGIIQAPSSALIAPSEQTVRPSFRTPQPKFSPVKPENTALHGPANSKLETLGVLTTARISATLPHQAPANPNNQTSPVPNIPVYHGRALGEFKTYARGLERHFDKYPGWYITDERKITRALKHVAFNLQNEWKRQIRDMPSEQVKFGGLGTFLIHQLQIGVYPEVAKARYMDSYQRPFQSVTDFSNWIQQWESHFHNNLSERDRMRHLFEHLSNRVRDEADKTHLDFTHYYDFVVYLQRIEDSIGKRAGPLPKKSSNPRKRPHTGS